MDVILSGEVSSSLELEQFYFVSVPINVIITMEHPRLVKLFYQGLNGQTDELDTTANYTPVREDVEEFSCG